ncbi:MAG: Hdr-like menaquinol oxidoreductase integral membrane subunit HmeB [Gammaproteobacteria bacterium]|nr:MAG: Hdr-like menaquinol oxidoreductase integral membrane subunit HmeB [Gammaproteobacteria bacterium]
MGSSMKRKVHFSMIEGNSIGYYALFALFGLIAGVGLLGAMYMEHYGHVRTGMNNSIVWGTPHVFAVFLIVAASGALNVASMASVFGRHHYAPLARLSSLLAIALMAGGLAVLMLDLGQPGRGFTVATVYYNATSVFSWNLVLYSVFFAAVIFYLWTMMESKMNKYYRPAGYAAFIWRLILTTGTGSIFGFLVARHAYDAAIMAPMFIIMSFAFGLAIFILVMTAAYQWSNRPLGDIIISRVRNLLGVFVAAVLYFTLVYHLTNLYVAENAGFERMILLGEGVSQYSMVFWIGHVIVGGILPLILLYAPPFCRSLKSTVLASILVILGGLAQMYVIIVGGQAYPMQLFSDKTVISSSFQDGQYIDYMPSMPEVLLGVGGIGIALIIVVFAIKIMPFMPNSLADKVVDPFHKPSVDSDATEA